MRNSLFFVRIAVNTSAFAIPQTNIENKIGGCFGTSAAFILKSPVRRAFSRSFERKPTAAWKEGRSASDRPPFGRTYERSILPLKHARKPLRALSDYHPIGLPKDAESERNRARLRRKTIVPLKRANAIPESARRRLPRAREVPGRS